MFLHLTGESEEDFATRLANNLEKTILEEGPETVSCKDFIFQPWFRSDFKCRVSNLSAVLQVAAFIAEPVMGAGGVIPPPETYFEKVKFWKCFVPGSSSQKTR